MTNNQATLWWRDSAAEFGTWMMDSTLRGESDWENVLAHGRHELARTLARTGMRHGPDLSVLEVGCGLGLAGIACRARGLNVTFSDVDETALTFAAANARLNGFREFGTVPIDFRCPPDHVKYPVVIGSDLMYEERLVDPLVGLLRAVLAPDGVCLITDPDRTPARRSFAPSCNRCNRIARI